ncbi:hypothetical protein WI664_18215 [Vibrio cholerae]
MSLLGTQALAATRLYLSGHLCGQQLTMGIGVGLSTFIGRLLGQGMDDKPRALLVMGYCSPYC